MCSFRNRFADASQVRAESLEERVFAVVEWATQPDQFEKALRYPTLILRALEAAKPETWGQRGNMTEDARASLRTILGMKGEAPAPAGGPAEQSIDEQVREILGG